MVHELDNGTDNVSVNATVNDVYVIASFTAEPLQNFLSEQLAGFGIASSLDFAPFGQVFQELLKNDGGLRRSVDGINLFLLRAEDLLTREDKSALQNNCFTDVNINSTEQLLNNMVAAITEFDTTNESKCLVVICSSFLELAHQDKHRGEYSIDYLRVLENRIIDKLLGNLSIAPITPRDFYVGHALDVFDPERNEMAQIPFSDSYFFLLAEIVATRIANLYGYDHKVVLLDADGTLWQGVCGEQDPGTLVITADQQHLQRILKAAKQQGMLLV